MHGCGLASVRINPILEDISLHLLDSAQGDLPSAEPVNDSLITDGTVAKNRFRHPRFTDESLNLEDSRRDEGLSMVHAQVDKMDFPKGQADFS